MQLCQEFGRPAKGATFGFGQTSPGELKNGSEANQADSLPHSRRPAVAERGEGFTAVLLLPIALLTSNESMMHD
jgi:hypothetical protein